MVRWCDLLTSVAEPNRSAFVFSSTIVRLRLLLLLGDASACMNSPVSAAVKGRANFNRRDVLAR